MCKFQTFVALLFAAGLVTANKASFENYRVYSVDVENDWQLQELHHLENADFGGLEFWKSPSAVGQRADIMVAPHQVAMFSETIEKLRLSSRLMVDNVQSLIDNEQPKTRESGFGWTAYHNLDTIYEWLDEQLLAYPNLLTNLTVGESYQNRTIRAVRLSHKAGNPTLMIEANIHAREWITSATATWLLNELLTSTHPDVQDLAQNIDWVIIPVFNVDGFAYTHSTNRLWRKTRQLHGHLCHGADANRNFDAAWLTVGATSNVCSETYAGPHAFSEPESRALAEFVARFAGTGNLNGYISFHSYGHLFMYPWGYTDEFVSDHENLEAIVQKTKDAIAVRYGTVYDVGRMYTTVYPASGTTADWVYDDQKVKLVFTFEFRDNGQYGFVLPANQIVPNALEILDGLIAMVKESRARNAL